MQKSEVVLSILREKSIRNGNFVFDRLYRNLFNADLYIRAYDKIYAKEGNMTPGVDNDTIDGFGYEIIEQLINKLKGERYYPNPVRRTYIPKKNGKMRPLGIPSFADKLVQEVVRQILEAIYEPNFLDTSHGFRKNRSCHTALYQIKTKCRGINWMVEGDITGFFDNIDHEILIKLLKKKISDGRFIELIRRFLNAGYLEFNQVYNSLSGTPQGGVISPILSNIYLHEFDKYMETIKNQYTTNKIRKGHHPYQKLYYKRDRAKEKGDWKLAKEMEKEMRKLPTTNPLDPNYIRVLYTRYADDFVISVTGSKSLAEEIRDKTKTFLEETLKLELNMEKTIITNPRDQRVRFLGYEISKLINNDKIVKNSLGRKVRAVNGSIQLLMPGDVINEKLKPFKKGSKAISCRERQNLSVIQIINEYNAEIRGLYNYYCLATDVSTKLGKFTYYHLDSMIHTIANKEKISYRQVWKKYGVDVPRKQGTGTRKTIGIRYKTKNGVKLLTYHNDSIKKVNSPKLNATDKFTSKYHQIIDRLNAKTCELCGMKSDKSKNFTVHHARNLKDITAKYKKEGTIFPDWLMVMRIKRRKTLVVCDKCHKDIHKVSSQRKGFDLDK